MQRSILVLACSLLAACSQASATTDSYAYNCNYYNVKTDKSYEGKCLETWHDDGSHEIVGGGLLFKFPAVEKRQGQWTMTSINGKPAAKYEIHRGKYSYATTDLTEFLDIE